MQNQKNSVNLQLAHEPYPEAVNDCLGGPNPLMTQQAVLALKQFTPHGLNDLKNANLMDRVDTKYLIPIEKLESLLPGLLPHYSALEINGKRLFTYQNTYFDTPDLDFYHAHHHGRLNRYKVRHRKYVDSEKGFLEVKFKNNKGRTLKTRIASDKACVKGVPQQTFLSEALSNKFSGLEASQWGSYQRIALANETCGERLTLDLGLMFRSIDGARQVELPQFFIAELKQFKHDLTSPFALEMARLGIRASKFSKYCMGCALITPSLKRNSFKPLLRLIKKFH
ncbi:MAG: polyphosphate polymerase domain-containing protein [Bermanella sp.]